MMKKNMLKIGIFYLMISFLFSCTPKKEEIDINRGIDELNVPKIRNSDGSFTQKENLIWLYRPSNNNIQNIYILGTIHQGHFDEKYNYSLSDIQSVIDIINPDILLIEVRQETIDNYGALDGPTEMIFTWCYAMEKDIAVKGIDWWHPSIGFPNTTPERRDDNIFNNIISASSNYENILVLIGASHLILQDMRFINHGYRRIYIPNKNELFNGSDNLNFTYPENYKEEINKHYDYFESVFIDEIYLIPEDNPYRQAWIDHVTRNIGN